MLKHNNRGFSLIELMTTVLVMSVLAMAAFPSFSTWIANSRVRSSAESIQNGLRLAQAEAVRRSRQVSFVLTSATPSQSATPTTNGQNWYIQALPLSGSSAGSSSSSASSTDYIRGESFANQFSVNLTGDAAICFNSAGRLVTNSATGLGANCSAPDTTTNYTVATNGADRPLRVEVSLGGKIRMCDPAKTLSSDTPDGCSTTAASASSSANSSGSSS